MKTKRRKAKIDFDQKLLFDDKILEDMVWEITNTPPLDKLVAKSFGEVAMSLYELHKKNTRAKREFRYWYRSKLIPAIRRLNERIESLQKQHERLFHMLILVMYEHLDLKKEEVLKVFARAEKRRANFEFESMIKELKHDNLQS